MSHAISFDRNQLDNRNERPLAIALTTIISVWALAFALTVASASFGGHAAFPVVAGSSVQR